MMNVSFLGNNVLSTDLKIMLRDVVLPSLTSHAELFIVSVESPSDLNNIPKKFEKPAVLYTMRNDSIPPAIIKNYNFSAVINASMPKEVIVKKLTTIYSQNSGKTVDEHEMFKAKVLAKAENIPPLPAIAQELLKLTRNDETSLKKIIDKIKTDQGFSAKILKLINSPFYALRKEITSIDQASMLIGAATIKNIVLSISIESFYQKNFSYYKMSGTELWKHSLETAVLAESIAKKLRLDSDAAYLAGLMHDIGKIVLVDFLTQEINDYNDEKNILGITHQEVSSIILSKWGLATTIISAVEEHHNISSEVINRVIFYANQLSHKKSSDEELINQILTDLKINLNDIIEIFNMENNNDQTT
ncbi:MAG: HDOD domain-containing protein [Deferribacterales bacterium]